METPQATQLRNAYTSALDDLTPEERFSEVQQLLVDMMDWTEQTEEEKLFVRLYNLTEEWANMRGTINVSSCSGCGGQHEVVVVVPGSFRCPATGTEVFVVKDATTPSSPIVFTVLSQLEFGVDNRGTCCPFCWNRKDLGHKSDCMMKAALDELRR